MVRRFICERRMVRRFICGRRMARRFICGRRKKRYNSMTALLFGAEP